MIKYSFLFAITLSGGLPEDCKTIMILRRVIHYQARAVKH